MSEEIDFDRIVAIIEEVGYEKAPRKLCKEKPGLSRKAAARMVKHVRIARGDKDVKEFHNG